MAYQLLEKYQKLKNGSVINGDRWSFRRWKIRYTFTNDNEDKVDVTAELEINLFIDPKTVQTNGNQTITSTPWNKLQRIRC